jgi:8-amino-7-oxononanoate synthase
MNEDFLNKKLGERKQQNAYRQLRLPDNKIDFCSNDYLGIVKKDLLNAHCSPVKLKHGSGGSRLLAGNYPLIEETERFIAGFHHAASGLIFNSGYDANTGLLSCIPQRGDTIIYDQLSHASIRDGIRLSFAQSFSFMHNSLKGLEEKLSLAKGNIFVVTESVFSMDGDLAPLAEICVLCKKYNAHLIVDEAHATGVVGDKGEGLAQRLGLQGECFARIHTFSKALGSHGAVVLGSELLRDFLINFSRPLIYTTALPEISIAAIRAAYEIFPQMNAERNYLQKLIDEFQDTLSAHKNHAFLESHTPIQGVIVAGNDPVKKISKLLAGANLDARPILYPSVPRGAERLRIVLHSFNTMGELDELIDCLRELQK